MNEAIGLSNASFGVWAFGVWRSAAVRIDVLRREALE